MSEERNTFLFNVKLIALILFIMALIDIALVPIIFFGGEPQTIKIGN